MKDFLGQQINIGDKVVYPNRHGGDMWLNYAQVTDVNLDSIRVRRDVDNSLKPLTRVDRVVVVTKQVAGHTVKIKPVIRKSPPNKKR